MLILSEFNIEFMLPAPTAMIALLHLHPSLQPRLQSSDDLLVESLGVPFPPNTVVSTVDYLDVFGNICSRFSAPAGHLRLSGSNVIEADEFPDTLYPEAQQMRVDDLPSEVLQFLLPSRYCEVDQFGAMGSNQTAPQRFDLPMIRSTNSHINDIIGCLPMCSSPSGRKPTARTSDGH